MRPEKPVSKIWKTRVVLELTLLAFVGVPDA